VVAIDHVQLAMPAGREDDAEQFYAGVLGLTRVPKPAALAARGGCWFVSADGSLQLHLGVEESFVAAKKAHPALVVRNLHALADALHAAGAPVRWDDEMPDVTRAYTEDPFGNRIELIDG
jgi:catechol 2,3-dioxygenase-like lactoylglutathione lyase family enzyme